MAFEFSLTYDDVPFLIDEARLVGLNYEDAVPVTSPESQLPPKKYQPFPDLVDEIERMMPTKYINDVYIPRVTDSANLNSLAQLTRVGSPVDQEVCLYDYLYPPTARRFSIFRGLMTSELVKSLVKSTNGGKLAKTFKLQMRPNSPREMRGARLATYTVETELFMLPPRCIGEDAKALDGLYLVTLVDERYYWQDQSITLHPNQNTTWDDLIETVAEQLGVSIVSTTIEAIYGQPELDSQLFLNQETASIVLDALAYNVGRVVVREYDGTYSLLTPSECNARVRDNRGPNRYVERTAGGNIYQSGGALPVGSLTTVRNAVLPSHVDVTFPKYVEGDDPVPHYLNPRYAPQRPSAWTEDSYGDVHVETFTAIMASGITSGVTGFSGSATLSTTAKALYDTESAATSGGTPTNQSGLAAIATQFASDYYGLRAHQALDETYPGVVKWQPDGIHDVVFTYSARRRGAFTRVTKTEWNQLVQQFQISTPPSSPLTTPVTRGVGGHSVALTVRDSITSGQGLSTQLSSTLGSGVTGTLSVVSASGLSASGNFRGQIGDEILYLRKLSDSSVGVIYRAIDGTKQADHAAGSTLSQVTPNTQYGVNLLTATGALTISPGIWSSGGISEALINVRPEGIVSGMIASGAVPTPPAASGVECCSGPIVQPPFYWSGTLDSSGLFYASGYGKFVLVAPTDMYIKGITGGTEGRLLFLLNGGGGAVVLGDQQGGAGNSILLPVAGTPGPSGYATGYTILPRNAVILEYISGIWRFDHPTMAAGDYGSPGYNTLGPPRTYAIQHLRFGSGLGYTDNYDGSANVFVSGITATTTSGDCCASGQYQLSGTGGGELLANTAVMQTGFTLLSGTTVWTDTGFGITIPLSGKYIFHTDVRGEIVAGIGPCQVEAKLHDNTTGADLPSSEREICYGAASATETESASINVVYASGDCSGHQINLYGRLIFTAPPTNAGIAAINTAITYMKLGLP